MFKENINIIINEENKADNNFKFNSKEKKIIKNMLSIQLILINNIAIKLMKNK